MSASGPVARLLRLARSRWVRAGFLVLCLVIAGAALAAEWQDAVAAVRRLGPVPLVVGLVLSAGNVLLAGMSWRGALADLGSPLPLRPAARVFLIGQLGKYVPGSVLQVVAQAELGRDYGVPRRRTASALAVQLILSVTSALLLVLVAAPFASGEAARRFGWAVLLAPLLLVLLHPRVLNPSLNAVLKRVGRQPLEHRTSLSGTARAGGWAVASWLSAGGQVALLAIALGAPATARTVALAVGGYCLAWAIGFFVVIAPAGAGAREAALAAVMSPVLDPGGLVVLVLLSRLLLTVADLALAALAVTLADRRLGQAAPGSGADVSG